MFLTKRMQQYSLFVAAMVALLPYTAFADATAIANKVNSKLEGIAQALQIPGYTICGIAAVVGAIMWGGGSPRGKAVLIGAVVGAGLIFIAPDVATLFK